MHGMMTTLRKAKREKKEMPDVPIWFSFAAQIYLDTLNIVKVIIYNPPAGSIRVLTKDVAGWQRVD